VRGGFAEARDDDNDRLLDRGPGDPEPFFDDDPDQLWRVIARPGSEVGRLRRSDLIVRRVYRDGVSGWHCSLARHENRRALYRRGPDRVLRDNTVVLRRTRRRPVVRPRLDTLEGFDEIVEVCGFFGPSNVRHTLSEMRTAVSGRATAEWTAWHSTAGAPRNEGEAALFGRLAGYYIAAAGSILPDTLTAIQATALGPINYAALLAPTADATTIASEASRIRGLLLGSAPGNTKPGLNGLVEAGLKQARQANRHSGPFMAWSAAFITACVRGAGITEGLEATIAPGRQHIGRNVLLQAALMHAGYTVEARTRRAATQPSRRGSYHAFTPAERAPQLGDIIVQDRRDGITAAQVQQLDTLASGVITHGDIVVEVQPQFIVTIGGNVGDSSRKRRYPLAADGKLVIDREQLYTQEDNAGLLPALPARSTMILAGRSTARIFAVLSLVEQCAAVPGQPYQGGILT
jgi:hypothetical protein